VRVRKWMLLSLLVLAMTTPPLCPAQGNGVLVEKLPLDNNSEVSRRCHSDLPTVHWVDDNTILIAYQIPPCNRNEPFKFGNTTMDIHRNTIASIDRDTSDSNFRHIEPGPNGGLLATSAHIVEVLDTHFVLLKSIHCEMTYCQTFLSADRSGFAICNEPVKDDCKYFRGPNFQQAMDEDFPGGFPLLDTIRRLHAPSAVKDKPVHYVVSNDEFWFFDAKGHAFRVKAGGRPEKLPSPASTLLNDHCGATISIEGHNRLLADCEDYIAFGDEMVLYDSKHIALYDVPSGRVLLNLNPGVVFTTILSPDGKRIAVARGGVLRGSSSVTIYYVP
jgi:hypothetical protein